MLAHMQPHSTKLKIGDKVLAGDKIGLVGNTGNTEEPHLHIHAFKETRSGSAVHNQPVIMRFNGEYLSRGECL